MNLLSTNGALVLSFTLLSTILCSTEATLRKQSSHQEKPHNKIAKRLTKEDNNELVDFLLSDECAPLFEEIYEAVSSNVLAEDSGDEEAIIKFACSEHPKELFNTMEKHLSEIVLSTGGENPTCAEAFAMKLMELEHWYHKVSSDYDICKAEVSSELSFLHSARRALVEVREDNRKLFWNCVDYIDDDDDSNQDIYDVYQPYLLWLNCEVFQTIWGGVNCHLDDDDYDFFWDNHILW